MCIEGFLICRLISLHLGVGVLHVTAPSLDSEARYPRGSRELVSDSEGVGARHRNFLSVVTVERRPEVLGAFIGSVGRKRCAVTCDDCGDLTVVGRIFGAVASSSRPGVADAETSAVAAQLVEARTDALAAC